MKKIRLLYYRPDYWRLCKSDIFDLIHVPIEGDEPYFHGRKHLKIADEVGATIKREGGEILKKAFIKYKPHFFLHFMLYGVFDGNFCQKLKHLSPDTRFIFKTDDFAAYQNMNRWVLERDYQKNLDIVLINTTNIGKALMWKRWGAKNVRYWLEGIDPRFFSGSVSEPEYDCFFGGGQTKRYPNSEERTELITRCYDTFNTKVLGGGWRNISDSIMMGVDYLREMRKAKIILNQYHLNLPGYITKRTLYALASRRLFVTNHNDHGDRLLDFISGLNHVSFHSVSQAIDEIKYYLENDERREEIATRGYQYVMKTHTWEDRLRDLEKIVVEL